jgi:hypothetical protein
MSSLADATQSFLSRRASEAWSFWHDAGSSARPDIMAACDTLYCLKLIGRMDLMAPDAPGRFGELLHGSRLAGGIGRGDGPPLGVHRTAYALAALNLLAAEGWLVHGDAVRPVGWTIGEILDGRGRVRWPWYLAHHAWRIGHWIGGIPSILLSLWRHVPELAEHNRLPHASVVLRNSDSLIDARTGLLRTYRLDTLQKAFRSLYRVRHDPDAADVGGIAHLHWCNYAAGRMPYKAAPALFDRSWNLLRRRPFMEAVPYCLDFDIVQIARTSIGEGDARSTALNARLDDYASAILDFYDSGLDDNYSLHKLPGGLATLHECAIAGGKKNVPVLEVPPVDIAKEAHWI